MNADSAFLIGSKHNVCQDYAVAGTGPNDNPYAVLSDGCSTSPDSDVGARLLVKAGEQIVMAQANDGPLSIHEAAANTALHWANMIGLPPESVDATLLTVHFSADEIVVGCSGDGVVVVETLQGSLDVYVVASPSGYPFYPTYVHQPDRLSSLLSQDQDLKEIKHFTSAPVSKKLLLHEASTSNRPTEIFRVRPADCKYIAILSDGIHSCFRTDKTTASKRLEQILMTEVLPELLAFKSLNGSFVARRVRRFIKDCRERGWQHTDDLSLAVVHVGGL